jgi:hypothetical protein
MYQLLWNKGTSYENVKEDLELRGYKLASSELQSTYVKKFISPGREQKIVSLDEEQLYGGSVIETQLSIWLPEQGHSRFLVSRYVDFARSFAEKTNMSTQTEPIDIPTKTRRRRRPSLPDIHPLEVDAEEQARQASDRRVFGCHRWSRSRIQQIRQWLIIHQWLINWNKWRVVYLNTPRATVFDKAAHKQHAVRRTTPPSHT